MINVFNEKGQTELAFPTALKPIFNCQIIEFYSCFMRRVGTPLPIELRECFISPSPRKIFELVTNLQIKLQN